MGGRLVACILENRRVFLTAGLGMVGAHILRQGRMVFLPLWGDQIGLDVAQIGLVIGISSFIDASDVLSHRLPHGSDRAQVGERALACC